MGEFKKRAKGDWAYHERVVEGGKCKDCGTGMQEEMYIALLKRHPRTYSVLCTSCYEKRRARKLGDRMDDAVVNRGKKDYEIADIVKGCRHLLMKMRVENDQLCKLIDEWDKQKGNVLWRGRGDNGNLSVAIRAFPLALKYIATGEFGNVGRYDKYRLELFIRLAMRLRTFLPRITGQMLERIYQRNKTEFKNKAVERELRHKWIELRDSLPKRLYSVTTDEVKLANWVRGLLPPSATTVAESFGYYDTKEKHAVLTGQLGMTKEEADTVVTRRATITVYNTAKGPRFLVTHD
jgi:hypothetical protein